MVLSEASKLACTPRSGFRRLLRIPGSMPRQNPPENHPARLSLISRHLAPVYPINTPFTVERLPDTIDTSLLPKTPSRSLSTSTSAKMSSQPAHPTLLIPGPIEFDDAVLQSMSHYR
jgi:alanine-glyoxylate transaminase/serine-glyoxylate transaminase/serine-pyruvate transaminase